MGADKRSFPPFRKEKIPQSHSPIGAPPNAACPSLSCATPAPRSLAPGLLPHALSPSENRPPHRTNRQQPRCRHFPEARFRPF